MMTHPSPTSAPGQDAATPATPKRAGRIRFLDALRGIAALVVVIHHGLIGADFAFYSGLQADSHLSWDVWLSGQPFFLVNAGNYAVCLFLVLSGFVLARAYGSTRLGPVPLVIKRYLRLTIPILVASLFSFAVWLATTGMPAPGTTSTAWTAQALWDAFRFCLVEALWKSTLTGLKDATYNGVLWTMQIEFLGSLILIAMFWLARLLSGRGLGKQDWLAVLATLVTVLLWNSYLGLLAAGVLLEFAATRLAPASSRAGTALALLCLLAGILFGTMPESNTRALFYNPFILATGGDPGTLLQRSPLFHGLQLLGRFDTIPFALSPISIWHGIGAIMTIIGVLWARPAHDFLHARVLRWLGHVSFPLYLTHATIRGAVYLPLLAWLQAHGLSFGAAMLCAMAVYVPAALLTAQLFTAAVEDKAMRWSALAGDGGQRLIGTFAPRSVRAVRLTR